MGNISSKVFLKLQLFPGQQCYPVFISIYLHCCFHGDFFFFLQLDTYHCLLYGLGSHCEKCPLKILVHLKILSPIGEFTLWMFILALLTKTKMCTMKGKHSGFTITIPELSFLHHIKNQKDKHSTQRVSFNIMVAGGPRIWWQ